MNDTMILELKNYVLSDEGKSNQINEVGNELVLAFETLTTMLLHFEGRARPDELLQMNNAIGDSLQLLEIIDPLKKFKTTGTYIRAGLLH